MKWIRCNNCYTRADIAKEPFTLTKCGHAYCTHCVIEAERRCPICNTVNVPIVRLQEPLDPGVRSYFTPLKDLLQQIIAVNNFQEEQLRVSMKRLNELDAKYVYCKDVCRKLEIAASKLHKKCRNDKEEYVKKIRNLENENVQLKLALDRVQISPCGNFGNTQSTALSSLNHTCKKRFQQNVSKVSFSTPLSTNTNASNASSQSDRKYLSSLAESRGIFQIPNISKVLRSAGTKSSASTVSTPSSMNPRQLRLNSLIISGS